MPILPASPVPHGVLGGMPLADLHAAWDLPFAAVADGGCPALPASTRSVY